VLGIDYDNFKATIPSKDALRHEAYFDCWEAMYRWQKHSVSLMQHSANLTVIHFEK
jgi:hypothetical protein